MKIIGIRPAPDGAGILAHADVEVVPGVRIYGVRVSRAADGSFRSFAPATDRGNRAAAFDHNIADQIGKLTVEGLSQNANARR